MITSTKIRILSIFTVFAIVLSTVTVTMPFVSADDVLPQGDLRWDFIEDTEGFEVESRAKIDGVFDGAMRVTSTRNDPILRVPNLSINPNNYRYFRFRMKNNTPSTWIEIFFWTKNNDAHKVVASVTPNSNEFVEYEIDLYAQSHPSITTNFKDFSEYKTLRFDPMNDVTVNTVDIDYVILSKYSKNDTRPEMINNIKIGEQVINDISVYSDDKYTEFGIYDDVFKNLSAEDITTVLNDKYEAGATSVSIKECNKKKIVDITAVCGSDIRTYRTVCHSIKRKVNLQINSFELLNKKLTFSGLLTDSKGNPTVRAISVLVHKKGSGMDEDVAYLGSVTSDSNGKFEKTIKLYDSETEPVMYEAEVVFDVSGADEPQKRYANYINNSYVDKSINDIKNSDNDVMVCILSDSSVEMYRDLGIWTNLYQQQNDKTKAKINGILNPYRKDLTSENIIKIVNGSILAVLTETLSSAELDELLTEINDKFEVITVNDKDYGTRDKSERNKICETIKKNIASGCESYIEFFKTVECSILLYDVNRTTYMELDEMLLKNTNLLDDELTDLKNETDSSVIENAMKKVVLRAATEEFTDIKTLVNFVKASFKEASKEPNNKKPSGGNSSGGGGGLITSGISSGDANNKDNDTSITENENKFDDMQNYGWADDAVNELCKSGVLSGTGNGKFEPERSVTREEFVKMIIGAFGFGTSDNSLGFNDVNKGDWFYSYVAKSVELGIINGISDTIFGTGECITREDMATIIYRVMKQSEVNFDINNVTFNDKDNISDYAQEAVAALSNAKIINGVGNNNFSPKAFASRAEAAVIIYRAVKQL